MGLTIYSLVKRCPGFHIVLVLSDEEFPKKEAELPDTIMVFVDNGSLEILWVHTNYKSFKKILFTSQKYKTVPIISADDDCVYTCNYANELYNAYCQYKCIIRYPKIIKKNHFVAGPYTIYPPYDKFGVYLYDYLFSNLLSIDLCKDDDYYNIVIMKNNLKAMSLNKDAVPCVFYAQHCAIHKNLI